MLTLANLSPSTESTRYIDNKHQVNSGLWHILPPTKIVILVYTMTNFHLRHCDYRWRLVRKTHALPSLSSRFIVNYNPIRHVSLSCVYMFVCIIRVFYFAFVFQWKSIATSSAGLRSRGKNDTAPATELFSLTWIRLQLRSSWFS